VAKITLNRPETMNAIKRTMFLEIGKALEDAEQDNNIAVVVLAGSGKSFYAGVDMKFTTLLHRKQNKDELDRIVEKWTVEHSPQEVMDLMQASGVAAGAVADAKDQAEDPQLMHYNFFEERAPHYR
jgi:enoyl-CoA hydratase/carnithine racemase